MNALVQVVMVVDVVVGRLCVVVVVIKILIIIVVVVEASLSVCGYLQLLGVIGFAENAIFVEVKAIADAESVSRKLCYKGWVFFTRTS